MVAVRQDFPNRNRGRATLMPVHFPSESGLPAETAHGRSNGWAPDSVRLGILSRHEYRVGQGFTDLTGRFNSAVVSRPGCKH